MPKTNISELSLDELCNGQFRRQILAALEEVFLNVEDPSTTEKSRTVSAKLIVTPSPDRRAAAIKVEVQSRLAGAAPVQSIFYLGRRGGQIQIAESVDPNQMTLDDEIGEATPFPSR